MFKSILWDNSDACILVNETKVVNFKATPDKNNKQVTFKMCAPFTDCVKQINNTQAGNTKDLDGAMRLCNL